jgi:hypothetical protein
MWKDKSEMFLLLKILYQTDPSLCWGEKIKENFVSSYFNKWKDVNSKANLLIIYSIFWSWESIIDD